MRQRKMLPLALASVIALCAGIVVMLTMMTPVTQDDGARMMAELPPLPEMPVGTAETKRADPPPPQPLQTALEHRKTDEIYEKIPERERFRLEWLDAATHVAKTTRDEDAEAVVKYLKDGMPHAPVGNGTKPFFMNGKRPGMLVLLAGETSPYQPHCSTIAYPRHPAASVESGTMIVIDGTAKLSKEWKGLLLLRAGKQSMDETYVDTLTPAELAPKEVKVLEFQHRLMRKLGGKAYENAIERLMSKWAVKDTVVRESIMDWGTDLPLAAGLFRPILEQGISTSASSREDDLRHSDMRYVLAFAFLDKTPDLKTNLIERRMLANQQPKKN